MWIKHVILENFTTIKTGMDTYRLEIDFSKRKNPICILVGPNGCGKTSLLSVLNPFATLGNLDVRDSQDLIIEGKPGYKEIEIVNNENTYLIKHFYSVNKNTHSVKSYIEKNGKELNTNGNVTSFKEYVKEELDIEMDYLKLVRLGKNVSSLLDASSTERKAFMSKIMDEIDVYLKYHKKITSELRELKTLISHNVDKLNSLHIDDISIMEKETDNLSDYIKNMNDNLSILNHKRLSITDFLNSNSGLANYTVEFKNISTKYNRMKNILEKYNDSEISVSKYENLISEIEKTISETDSEITKLNVKLTMNLNQLNSLLEEKSDIDIEMKKYSSRNSELKACRDQINQLTSECNEKKEFWKDVNIKYTKKEVEDFMIYLREWQEKISNVYAYGLPVMKKVIELISENRDVIAYTNNGILECMKNDDVMTYLKKILGDAMLYANSSNVTSQKTQACKGCIGYYLYMSISDMTKINSSSSEHNIEFYQYVSTASQVITSFLESTKKQKDLIIRLPKKIQDIFLLDKLYTKLSKCEQFYSLEEVSDLYSYISEYENYHERLELLKELECKEQTIINDNEYNILINRKNTLENKISVITDEITTDKFTIEELNDDLSNYNKKLNENKEILSSLTDFSIVESEYNDKKVIYDKMVEQTSELNSVLMDIKSLVKELEKSQKQLEQNHYAIKQYKELKKSLKKYNEVYDDLETLRMALSSKEGIPLVFIQMYLANTKDIANELLDIVFNGSIEIDNFEITANDFLIPYIKNGKKIKDVKSASQGELSFFQLAISFALNYQSISKYNIMLLDEIDGGLDPINREKFIQILDHQIEMINAEQVFLITHNEMFNTDDVDIIDLTPGIPQKESRTSNVIVKKK